MNRFINKARFTNDVNIHKSQKLMEELYNEGKVISVGKFLEMVLDEFPMQVELSFVSGTAFPLNYFIIKGLCMKFQLNVYLEIGSYIGESIYNVSDVCGECISITAPVGSPWSMKGYCDQYRIKDYSNCMVNTEKVQQYLTNSQKFNFNKIKKHPDIILIDGEGTYNGVKKDTFNIKQIKSRDTIVLWQLVKRNPSSRVAYRDILAAVRKCLTKEEWNRFYVFDNATFGILIPDKYIAKMKECLLCNQNILYTYSLNVLVNERKTK